MKNLLKIRLQQLRNLYRQATPKQITLILLLGASILGAMTFIFIKLFGFLYKQDEFPMFFKLFLCEKILMMNFLTMYLMLILSSLISTLNIFFLSKDLHLLLSSPLPSRKVFAWKAVEVAATSSLMVVFFSLPVLFAYSYYFAPSIIAIAAMLVTFLLFIVSGVLVGIIIGFIVPAFISVRKLQPVLSVVSILLISGIVILLRLMRPEQFGNPTAVRDLVEYMGGLQVRGASWFPFSWIARAFHMLAKPDFIGFLKEIAPFALIISFFGLFIYFLQKKYYLTLFDKLNKGDSGTYRSTWKTTRWLSPDYHALLKKEVKTFWRTPAQWSQLLVVGAIVIVFVLNIKGIPLPHPSVKNLIAYLNLGMSAFIVAGLNSRFTFTSIPMESPGIINIMASPFSKEKLLRFKIVFYIIPQVIIGFSLFFIGDTALEMDSFSRFTGIVFLIPILPLLTILALYFSLKVDESVPLTPQHLVASRYGIAYMLWSMLFIVVGMIYFVRPLFLYYYSKWAKVPVPVLEITLWYSAFVLINIALFIIFYKKCISSWNKKEISNPTL